MLLNSIVVDSLVQLSSGFEIETQLHTAYTGCGTMPCGFALVTHTTQHSLHDGMIGNI